MRFLSLLLLFVGTAYAAAPVVTCTPNRTTGTAPLAVFLDCTSTTDAETTRPFHDLLYRHSFGETASALWTYGANTAISKNSAYDAVAGHVYETAGTYVITSLVTDAVGGNPVKATNTIVVSDPNTTYAGATMCVNASGVSHVGCPLIPGTYADSAACVAAGKCVTQSNFVTIASTYMLANTRTLLKKGDTFSAASIATFTNSGGTLGAYGTGAKPIIQATGGTAILQISGALCCSVSTPTDWRIMDIEFDGQSVTGTFCITGGGGMDRITILRVYCHHVQGGIYLDYDLLNTWNGDGNPARHGHHIWDQLAIVDSVIGPAGNFPGGGSGTNCLYISATKFLFLGNLADDSTKAEHVLRLPYCTRCVLSNNTLSNPRNDKHELKLHAPAFAGDNLVAAGTYSELVIISDNKFLDGTLGYVSLAVQPQNSSSNERIRNIIIERNWFVAGASVQTQSTAYLTGDEITFRNNLSDHTGATFGEFVIVSDFSNTLITVPTNNRIYANTFYMSSATAGAIDVVFIQSATAAPVATLVKNNLAYAPLASSILFITDNGSGTIGASGTFGNSSTAQIKATSPSFDGTSVPKDFRIGTGSYAATGGQVLFPSSNDDFFHCDDTTANEHIGAFVPRVRARCISGTRQ